MLLLRYSDLFLLLFALRGIIGSYGAGVIGVSCKFTLEIVQRPALKQITTAWFLKKRKKKNEKMRYILEMGKLRAKAASFPSFVYARCVCTCVFFYLTRVYKHTRNNYILFTFSSKMNTSHCSVSQQYFKHSILESRSITLKYFAPISRES